MRAGSAAKILLSAEIVRTVAESMSDSAGGTGDSSGARGSSAARMVGSAGWIVHSAHESSTGADESGSWPAESLTACDEEVVGSHEAMIGSGEWHGSAHESGSMLGETCFPAVKEAYGEPGLYLSRGAMRDLASRRASAPGLIRVPFCPGVTPPGSPKTSHS